MWYYISREVIDRMNTRIKKIRESEGLSQTKFGNEISISRSGVCKLESGENTPSEQTIKLICSQFSIREDWLRYGTGDMHAPVEDEEAKLIEDLLSDTDNELYVLIKSILKTYDELDHSGKEVIKSFAKSFIKNINHEP
jgi:transcriptional regulator with XRE-family HTH domain